MTKKFTSIINTSKNPSDPIVRGKRTLNLKRVGNNDCVSFTLTEGKGTSEQPISFENLTKFIGAMEWYRENGIPSRKENSDMTDIEFFHNSITEKDGYIEFRTYGGRGAKPTRFPSNRFDDVIKFMKEEVVNFKQLCEKGDIKNDDISKYSDENNQTEESFGIDESDLFE